MQSVVWCTHDVLVFGVWLVLQEEDTGRTRDNNEEDGVGRKGEEATRSAMFRRFPLWQTIAFHWKERILRPRVDASVIGNNNKLPLVVNIATQSVVTLKIRVSRRIRFHHYFTQPK